MQVILRGTTGLDSLLSFSCSYVGGDLGLWRDLLFV